MSCRQCGIEVKDFGRSWRNGIAFNAMIYNLNPELVDLAQLPHNPARVNLENAFTTAEVHLGIPRLLDAEGNKCCISEWRNSSIYSVSNMEIFSTAKMSWLFRDASEIQHFFKLFTFDIGAFWRTLTDLLLRCWCCTVTVVFLFQFQSKMLTWISQTRSLLWRTSRSSWKSIPIMKRRISIQSHRQDFLWCQIHSIRKDFLC